MSTAAQLRSSAALTDCPADVRDDLAAACDGAELSFEQGLRLATAQGPALDALVAVADALRRETVGDTITYVVNRNINFTNVCFVGCSFCGFARGPGAPDAYSHSPEHVVRKAHEAWDRGATEVCIQGGLPRDLDGFFYRDLLRAIKRAIPEMHVHAFSPMEISYGVDKTGMPLRDYLHMMKDEGLGSIPGTAAEILDDRVRQQLSPNKLPVARWVEIITTAHELGIPTTSTMMYGHVEEPADWVRHILLLRSIQKRTGGFTEFVPLGFIHENTRLYKHGGARAGARHDDHLRVHALVARAAARRDQKSAGVLGEAGIRGFARVPEGRRKRFQRHVDGREHLESSGRHVWRVRFARGISAHDSFDRARARGAQHHVQDSPLLRFAGSTRSARKS